MNISAKISIGVYDKNTFHLPRELARILKHRKDYARNGIRLLSCNTGSIPDGFAQHLANKLNVTVWALTIWYGHIHQEDIL